MKTDRVKQIICISESAADLFEERMNQALAGLADPEIRIDSTRSFTAIIIYTAKRDAPEDILELLEMVDGGHYHCKDCPHYIPPTDRRRKWGSCGITFGETRGDAPACVHLYLLKNNSLSDVSEKYKELPFVSE